MEIATPTLHGIVATCLALLMAAGCSEPVPSPHDVAPVEASAPAARILPVGTDPLRMRYDAIRATFSAMQSRGELAPGAFEPILFAADEVSQLGADVGSCPAGKHCAFDLVDCTSGADYLPQPAEGVPGDEVESQLAATAFAVLRLEHLLRGQRYPDASWRPVLERHEQAVLDKIRSDPPRPDNFEAYSDLDIGLQQSLLASLRAHREQSDPSLLLPVAEGGCGAGELGILVATEPAGGVAEFIPVFHYRLCGVRGVDPDDTRACDHWREAADGMLFDVAGDYRYRVRWPDGHVSGGKLSFINLEEGQTVTLRRR